MKELTAKERILLRANSAQKQREEDEARRQAFAPVSVTKPQIPLDKEWNAMTPLEGSSSGGLSTLSTSGGTASRINGLRDNKGFVTTADILSGKVRAGFAPDVEGARQAQEQKKQGIMTDLLREAPLPSLTDTKTGKLSGKALLGGLPNADATENAKQKRGQELFDALMRKQAEERAAEAERRAAEEAAKKAGEENAYADLSDEEVKKEKTSAFWNTLFAVAAGADGATANEHLAVRDAVKKLSDVSAETSARKAKEEAAAEAEKLAVYAGLSNDELIALEKKLIADRDRYRSQGDSKAYQDTRAELELVEGESNRRLAAWAETATDAELEQRKQELEREIGYYGRVEQNSEKARALQTELEVVNREITARKDSAYHAERKDRITQLEWEATTGSNFEKTVAEGRQLVADAKVDRFGDTDGMAEIKQFETLSPGQQEVLLYYHTTGQKDKADEYWNAIKWDVNAEAAAEQSTKYTSLAEKNPLLGGAVSVGASFGTPAAWLGTVLNMAKNEITGTYTPVDLNSEWYSAARVSEAAMTGASKGAEIGVSIAGKDIGSFLVETGISIGQFLSKVPLGPLSLAYMGAGAAGETTYQALKSGATSEQALLLGTAAGVIEAATEKIGLDNLFDIAKNTGKSGIKKAITNLIGTGAGAKILSQMGSEAAEEAISEVANKLVNLAVMGQRSDFMVYVNELMTKQGLTRSQAEAEAFKQFFLVDTMWAAVGGALSGGVTGAGGTAFAALDLKIMDVKTGKAIAMNADQYGAIQAGLLFDKNSKAYQLASALDARATNSAGAIVSTADVGKLIRLMNAERAQYGPETAEGQAQAMQAAENAAAGESGEKAAKVLTPAAEKYMELGVDPVQADAAATVAERLAAGDTTLSGNQLRKLQFRNPVMRQAFTAATGIEVNEVVTNADAVREARRILSEQAQVQADRQSYAERAAQEFLELEEQFRQQAAQAEQRAAQEAEQAEAERAAAEAAVPEKADTIQRNAEQQAEAVMAEAVQAAEEEQQTEPPTLDEQVERAMQLFREEPTGASGMDGSGQTSVKAPQAAQESREGGEVKRPAETKHGQSAPGSAVRGGASARGAQQTRNSSYFAVRGYGSKGTEVFLRTLEESGLPVDKVQRVFQRAYEMGRTGRTPKNGELKTVVQRQAYEAGRADARADRARDDAAEKRGAPVSETAGFDSTGVPKDVTTVQIEIVDKLAKLLGVHVRIGETLNDANAQISGDTVIISPTFQREVRGRKTTIVEHAVHEMAGHRLVTLMPKEGRAFINALYNHLSEGRTGGATLAQLKQAHYGAHGVTLTTDKAVEEISVSAIFSELYCSDEQALNEVLDRILNGTDEAAKKGARTFRDILNDIVEKLRRIVSRLRGADSAEGAQIADRVAELRDMFEAALEKAADRAWNADPEAQKNTAREDGGVQFSNRDEVLALDGVDWMGNFTRIKDQLEAHASELNKMKPVAVVEYGKMTRDQVEAQIMEEVAHVGGQKMKHGSVTFDFDKQGANSIAGHAKNNPELQAAALAAPYVAKFGKLVAGQKNHEGTGMATLTYAAPVVVNETTVNVGVVVQFQANGRPRAVNVGLQSGGVFKIDMTKAPKGFPSRVYRYGKGTALATLGAFGDNVSQPDPSVNSENPDFSLKEEEALNRFGTTTDFEEAGFILPGGQMLRFTDDDHSGERIYDHRAIGMVYGVDVDLSVNHGFNMESNRHLDEFVEGGGIRFDAGVPDLDMDIGLQLSSTVPLTRAQEQVIRDLVRWKTEREERFETEMTEESFLYDGPLAIRIDFGGDSGYAVGSASAKDLAAWGKKSLEYTGGNINAERIISDIRHYYQTGEVKKPSEVAQFHFSLREEAELIERDLEEYTGVEGRRDAAVPDIVDKVERVLRRKAEPEEGTMQFSQQKDGDEGLDFAISRDTMAAEGKVQSSFVDLTEAEESALLQYKSSESYKINAKLRDGTALNSEESRFVANLDAALEKLPAYHGLVFRRLSFDMFGGKEALAQFAAEHQPGATVGYPAYTSASTEADGYGVDGEHTAELHIYGEGARDVAGFGNNFESEVIFPRNGVFTVISAKTTAEGRLIIQMKEETYNGKHGQLHSEERGEAVQPVQTQSPVYRDVQGISERDPLGRSGREVGSPEPDRGGQRGAVRGDTGGEQFSMKEDADILADSRRLREVSSYLQEQFESTDFTKADPKAAGRMARQLVKDYSSKADTDGIQDALEKLYTAAKDGIDGESLTWAEGEEMAREIALQVLEGAVELDDGLYQEYSELRSYLKSTELVLGEEYHGDIPDFREFRLANAGRLKLKSKGRTNVDEVYAQLSRAWPELFNEGEHSQPADQLLHIAEVLDSIQPVEFNPYSQDMDEAAAWLSADILSRLIDLPAAAPTLADRFGGKIPGRVRRSITELRDTAERLEREIGELSESKRRDSAEAKDRIRVLEAELRYTKAELEKAQKAFWGQLIGSEREKREAGRKAAQDKKTAVESQKSRDKEKLEAQKSRDKEKLDTQKKAHREKMDRLIRENRAKVKTAVAGERMAAGRELAALKRRHEEQRAKTSESQKAGAMRAKILRHLSPMEERVTRASNKKHIPQELKGTVIALLEAINQESNYTYDPATYHEVLRKDGKSGGMTGKHLKDGSGILTKRTEAFRDLKNALAEIRAQGGSGMTIDPSLLGSAESGIPSKFDEVLGMKDRLLADMTLPELTTVWEVLRATEAAITSANKALAKGKHATITGWANSFRSGTDTRAEKISLTKAHTTLDILVPYTFFSQYGKGGKEFFRMLRDAQDHQTVMQGELAERIAELVSAEAKGDLEKRSAEYVTEGGEKLTLSRAQMMDLYLLSKRPAARQHLLGNGVVQPEVGRLRRGTKAVKLTEADLNAITGESTGWADRLTEAERKLADDIRGLTGLLAQWGNEAHMKVFGYEKFSDANYWPIRSSDLQTRKEDGKKAGDTTRSIANMGAAKELVPNANNAVDLNGVFDTFNRHASEMLTYAAWLAPMEDANRILNFSFRNDAGGVEDTMSGLLERYGGEGSTDYWTNLMSDIQNGLSIPPDTSSEGALVRGYGKLKRAAVAANARVVIQQPTAFARAATVLDPDIMVAALGKGAAVKPAAAGWKKAVRLAPIAARKAAGGYEIAASPAQLGEQLYRPGSGAGKVKAAVKEAGLLLPGLADQLTWGSIWNACEMQVSRDNKKIEKGSAAFDEAVKELFTEVIDQTQVVDGVLQRSQAMRSGSAYMKQLTAFTGEPTLGANMVIRAWDAWRYETDPAKKKAARASLGRASAVFFVTAALNAFAQALIDGVRDDDKEKDYWERVWSNFSGIGGDETVWHEYARNILLAGNVANNLNPLSFMPMTKDIMSLIQGYSAEKMEVSFIGDLIDSVNKVTKAMSGEGKQTAGYASVKGVLLALKLFGFGGANLLRDLEGAVRTVQLAQGDYVALYNTEKLMTRQAGNKAAYIDILYSAYKNDTEAYEIIYADLIKEDALASGSKTTAEYIASAIEERMKKDQGVESVDDLSVRYLAPEQKKSYDRVLSAVQDSRLWSRTTEKEREFAEGKLYDLTVGNSDGVKLQEKIDAGADVGVSDVDLIMLQLALAFCDEPTESGKLGSYTQQEVGTAIKMVPGLTDEERSYFWTMLGKSEKSNPWG